MPEMMEDVLGSCYKLLDKLSDMESTYRKDVNKETQQNDFCYEHLKVTLKELGFLPKPAIKHCDICTFGKSMMDLYFYKTVVPQLNQQSPESLKMTMMVLWDTTMKVWLVG